MSTATTTTTTTAAINPVTDDVRDALRMQAKRRSFERAKIAVIAGTPSDDIHSGLDLDAAVKRELDKENIRIHKVVAVAAAAAAPGAPADDGNTNYESGTFTSHPTSTPPSRCRSPNAHEDSALAIAQLKSRVVMLENEAESTRAVLDLARRESAVLRDVLQKVAVAVLGLDWKAKTGVSSGQGVCMSGMGAPAAELTAGQRERLITLLQGEKMNLLP